MDFVNVIYQTVCEIKREVILKVLKVPEIEKKVAAIQKIMLVHPIRHLLKDKSHKILFCCLDNIAMRNQMKNLVKVANHEGTEVDKDENLTSEKPDQENKEHSSSLDMEENGVIEDVMVSPSHKKMDEAEKTTMSWTSNTSIKYGFKMKNGVA